MLLNLDALGEGTEGILARILSTAAANANAPRVEAGVDLTVTYFSGYQVTSLLDEVMGELDNYKPLKVHTALHRVVIGLKHCEQLFIVEELNEMTVVSDGHREEFALTKELYDGLSKAEEPFSEEKRSFIYRFSQVKRLAESSTAS